MGFKCVGFAMFVVMTVTMVFLIHWYMKSNYGVIRVSSPAELTTITITNEPFENPEAEELKMNPRFIVKRSTPSYTNTKTKIKRFTDETVKKENITDNPEDTSQGIENQSKQNITILSNLVPKPRKQLSEADLKIANPNSKSADETNYIQPINVGRNKNEHLSKNNSKSDDNVIPTFRPPKGIIVSTTDGSSDATNTTNEIDNAPNLTLLRNNNDVNTTSPADTRTENITEKADTDNITGETEFLTKNCSVDWNHIQQIEHYLQMYEDVKQNLSQIATTDKNISEEDANLGKDQEFILKEKQLLDSLEKNLTDLLSDGMITELDDQGEFYPSTEISLAKSLEGTTNDDASNVPTISSFNKNNVQPSSLSENGINFETPNSNGSKPNDLTMPVPNGSDEKLVSINEKGKSNLNLEVRALNNNDMTKNNDKKSSGLEDVTFKMGNIVARESGAKSRDPNIQTTSLNRTESSDNMSVNVDEKDKSNSGLNVHSLYDITKNNNKNSSGLEDVIFKMGNIVARESETYSGKSSDPNIDRTSPDETKSATVKIIEETPDLESEFEEDSKSTISVNRKRETSDANVKMFDTDRVKSTNPYEISDIFTTDNPISQQSIQEEEPVSNYQMLDENQAEAQTETYPDYVEELWTIPKVSDVDKGEEEKSEIPIENLNSLPSDDFSSVQETELQTKEDDGKGPNNSSDQVSETNSINQEMEETTQIAIENQSILSSDDLSNVEETQMESQENDGKEHNNGSSSYRVNDETNSSYQEIKETTQIPIENFNSLPSDDLISVEESQMELEENDGKEHNSSDQVNVTNSNQEENKALNNHHLTFNTIPRVSSQSVEVGTPKYFDRKPDFSILDQEPIKSKLAFLIDKIIFERENKKKIDETEKEVFNASPRKDNLEEEYNYKVPCENSPSKYDEDEEYENMLKILNDVHFNADTDEVKINSHKFKRESRKDLPCKEKRKIKELSSSKEVEDEDTQEEASNSISKMANKRKSQLSTLKNKLKKTDEEPYEDEEDEEFSEELEEIAKLINPIPGKKLKPKSIVPPALKRKPLKTPKLVKNDIKSLLNKNRKSTKAKHVESEEDFPEELNENGLPDIVYVPFKNTNSLDVKSLLLLSNAISKGDGLNYFQPQPEGYSNHHITAPGMDDSPYSNVPQYGNLPQHSSLPQYSNLPQSNQYGNLPQYSQEQYDNFPDRSWVRKRKAHDDENGGAQRKSFFNIEGPTREIANIVKSFQELTKQFKKKG
ncbi:hypothetical protein M8J77_020925 [Diaphorina citri]|nr:hypothetical protein M8J77_020925 [Diaphorina citri]